MKNTVSFETIKKKDVESYRYQNYKKFCHRILVYILAQLKKSQLKEIYMEDHLKEVLDLLFLIILVFNLWPRRTFNKLSLKS